ncbi:PASTA domain-containing protein [Arthrobacter sp. NQ7]|uniref:PASTA domain-containing protein n=1 Tax=Arthrobacter sp. NQ7 TaxID=3032303 RepID=UPI002410ADB7|nr:PASTA domain-containing protein [Arthrobacter sp. NQ7]MDJ0459899.1 PASTA domain-containing protein [Arthrobacter sp. NQ7]
MKKSLTVMLLAALLTAGCSSKAAVDSSSKPSVEPVAAATTTAASTSDIAVPDEVGKRLDKAEAELKGLGLKYDAKDAIEGKTIILESNWEVISQDPVGGTTAPKGTKVKLGVKHLTYTPSPTPTPTPTPTPVPVVGGGVGGDADVNVNPPALPQVPVAPPAVPEAPKYGGIVCKDGYPWPGTTRQGACHGHGGIAN